MNVFKSRVYCILHWHGHKGNSTFYRQYWLHIGFSLSIVLLKIEFQTSEIAGDSGLKNKESDEFFILSIFYSLVQTDYTWQECDVRPSNRSVNFSLTHAFFYSL